MRTNLAKTGGVKGAISALLLSALASFSASAAVASSYSASDRVQLAGLIEGRKANLIDYSQYSDLVAAKYQVFNRDSKSRISLNP